MKAKIYLSYFSDAALIRNNILTPIQVGSELSPKNLNMLKDNSGDNISVKNPQYCEMTAVYWAWKNDLDSDYIGFFHYRRLLDFNITEYRTLDVHGLVNYHGVDDYLYENFNLNEEGIIDLLSQYDAILPEPFDVSVTGNTDIYTQYANSNHQHKKDIDIALQVVKDLSPEYFIGVKKHFEEKMLYPTNIFCLNRPIFNELCEWLFPILEEVENRIDTSSYSFQENRVIGYLSERLISAFIKFKIVNNPNISHLELKRVFIKSTENLPKEPKVPSTNLPVMSLAISSDSNYIPHLGALIASIVENRNKNYYLDFIILDGGISYIQKKLLNNIVKLEEDISINYLDMQNHLKFIVMHSYFAQPTLYRLYLADILKSRNKILFLDTDMVVVDDLTEIYETDLEDNYVVATQDLIMRTFVHKKIKSHEASGGLETLDYLKTNVCLNHDPAQYFQAGTLLLNLQKIRESNIIGKMIDDISNNNYWFLDQDILNKYLGEKVKLVDNRWNVVHIPEGHVEHLHEDEMKKYIASLEDPAIIHYAGQGKPWKDNINPHSHYYWYYLRKTAWYETLLFGFINISRQMDHKPIEYKIEVPKTEEFIKVYKRRIRKGMRDAKSNFGEKILNTIKVNKNER